MSDTLRSFLIIAFQILSSLAGWVMFSGNMKLMSFWMIMTLAVTLLAFALAPWKDETK